MNRPISGHLVGSSSGKQGFAMAYNGLCVGRLGVIGYRQSKGFEVLGVEMAFSEGNNVLRQALVEYELLNHHQFGTGRRYISHMVAQYLANGDGKVLPEGQFLVRLNYRHQKHFAAMMQQCAGVGISCRTSDTQPGYYRSLEVDLGGDRILWLLVVKALAELGQARLAALVAQRGRG